MALAGSGLTCNVQQPWQQQGGGAAEVSPPKAKSYKFTLLAAQQVVPALSQHPPPTFISMFMHQGCASTVDGSLYH